MLALALQALLHGDEFTEVVGVGQGVCDRVAAGAGEPIVHVRPILPGSQRATVIKVAGAFADLPHSAAYGWRRVHSLQRRSEMP